MKQTETSPRRVRLMTALLLAATFAAGTAAGAGLCRWAAPCHGPPGPPPFALEQFRELGLSPDQQSRAREIAERHRPELEEILRATFPKVRAIHEQMGKELRERLTAEQRTKLDEIEARRPPPGSPFPGGPPPGRGRGRGPHGPFGPPPDPPLEGDR
jgi:hypothetical protein